MCALNMKKQMNIISKIKNAQKDIRRKTLAIKLNEDEKRANIEKDLKSVSEPLKKIVDSNNLFLENKKKKGIHSGVDNHYSEDGLISGIDFKNGERKRFETSNTPLRNPIERKEQDSIAVDTPDWDPFQTSFTLNDNPKQISSKSWSEVFENVIPEHPEEDKQEIIIDRRKSTSNLDYYLNMLHANDDKIDRTSGVSYKRGRYELNRVPVTFEARGSYKAIKIGNDFFSLTPGINELLFMRQPNDDLITQLDVRQYKKIAESCAFTGEKKLKTNKLKQYLGSGVFMEDNSKKKEYIYWDNPNELVTRLQLLHASKSAGHTGHNNEILNIEEELRERGYIK